MRHCSTRETGGSDASKKGENLRPFKERGMPSKRASPCLRWERCDAKFAPCILERGVPTRKKERAALKKKKDWRRLRQEGRRISASLKKIAKEGSAGPQPRKEEKGESLALIRGGEEKKKGARSESRLRGKQALFRGPNLDGGRRGYEGFAYGERKKGEEGGGSGTSLTWGKAAPSCLCQEGRGARTGLRTGKKKGGRGRPLLAGKKGMKMFSRVEIRRRVKGLPYDLSQKAHMQNAGLKRRRKKKRKTHLTRRKEKRQKRLSPPTPPKKEEKKKKTPPKNPWSFLILTSKSREKKRVLRKEMASTCSCLHGGKEKTAMISSPSSRKKG